MNLIVSFFKRKINFSNFWFRNFFILLIVSVLANHLIDPENFPLNASYQFPWLSIVISMFLGSVIIVIATFNFRHFSNKYFLEKINVRILFRFLFSTLGYISIIYIALYSILVAFFKGIDAYSVYHLLIGLLVTLLISSLGIVILFSNEIYKLHKFAAIHGKLKVRQVGKITLVNFSEIAFIYSENKIVSIVKVDGTSIITDFTLNEVEAKVSEQSFFRANRQTVLHSRSIEQIESIENGKLSVVLKPAIADQKVHQIIISRYKKQSFIDWFENKL